MKPTKRLITLLLTALLLAMPVQSFAATQYSTVTKVWGAYADIGSEPSDASVIPAGSTVVYRSSTASFYREKIIVQSMRFLVVSYDDGGPSAATITNSLNAQSTAINNSLNAQTTALTNTLNTGLAKQITSVVYTPRVGAATTLAKHGLSTSLTVDGVYASSDGTKYRVVFYDPPTNISQLNLS